MNHYEETIEALKREIVEMEDEIIQSKRMVNRLCVKSGVEPAYPPEQLQSSDAALVRSDQFYGQPLATAVKLAMSMRRAAGNGPAPVLEIYSTLLKGGYKFETDSEDNAKRSLRISLQKNPDFHRLPNGHYGLTEWYPKAKSNDKSDSGKSPGSPGDDTSESDDSDEGS